MSSSPLAKQVTGSKAIPTRKVVINDACELPNYYSATPGGTLYSTTPGGTRIVYEPSFIMNLRNSPLSKTPPTYEIPSSLLRGSTPEKKTKSPSKRHYNKNHIDSTKRDTKQIEDEDQFSLDL
ncbi:hypothetical protein WA026_000530 [Henosepilachna vigintioctopunctata]|uniref:Eukaryotic translation initiation factor 4E binding protein n=1 Tax=Henosepilachna vigintioctopunctata TaxID=420089 RepID=A0AAW1UXX6_9CUCU